MQAKWLVFGGDVNPLVQYNPTRFLVYRYNKWRMDRYISKHLDRLLSNPQGDAGKRTIIDLALEASHSAAKNSAFGSSTDYTFRSFALSQVKLFLFSGHDTTSSSVCYLFYVLARNSEAREHMRNEHNEVFGMDLDRTALLLQQDPALLNRIPYTIAVIKETLRLYPTVSSTRAGEPGFSIMEHGLQYPTDGFLVWANPQTIHRDPSYWPEPDKFMPERWLASPGDPIYLLDGAWRPFERGPRNCIGQELAMMEMKIILVMTVRRYNVQTAYEELDRSTSSNKIKTMYGERGYQIQRAQPSGDLPCRVTRNAL